MTGVAIRAWLVACCRPLKHRAQHGTGQRGVPCATPGVDLMPSLHGGPRFGGKPVMHGGGNRARPASTAIVRSRPALQQGHTSTSIFATRTMNACADSMARGLTAGICSARRAAVSLTRLQALANTP